ncbi:MAG: hypothetical protein WCQ49_01455 [Candidatus Saccharibacteria bacterium]
MSKFRPIYMVSQLSTKDIAVGDRIISVCYNTEPYFSNEIEVTKITGKKVFGSEFESEQIIREFGRSLPNMGLEPYEDGSWDEINFTIKSEHLKDLFQLIEQYGNSICGVNYRKSNDFDDVEEDEEERFSE